jgi:flagellar biosynthesis protein FliP
MSALRIIRLRITSLVKGITWILLLGWYIFVTVKFFEASNDCRKKSPEMWAAHFILLIDAFLNFLLIVPILIFVCFAICLLICFSKIRMGRSFQRNVLGIRKVISNAVALQLDPNDIADDEE